MWFFCTGYPENRKAGINFVKVSNVIKDSKKLSKTSLKAVKGFSSGTAILYLDKAAFSNKPFTFWK